MFSWKWANCFIPLHTYIFQFVSQMNVNKREMSRAPRKRPMHAWIQFIGWLWFPLYEYIILLISETVYKSIYTYMFNDFRTKWSIVKNSMNTADKYCPNEVQPITSFYSVREQFVLWMSIIMMTPLVISSLSKTALLNESNFYILSRKPQLWQLAIYSNADRYALLMLI